jgi:cobalt-zinc-cadmium efflux system outer membrane protein
MMMNNLFRGAIIAGLFLGPACTQGAYPPTGSALENHSGRYPGNDLQVSPLRIQDAESYTLYQILQRVEKENPGLKVLKSEINARGYEKNQASAFLNPELEVESEAFGGSGDYSRFKSSETTLQLSQTFELGGKRRLRGNLAAHWERTARRDYDVQRQNLMAETKKAFYNVLATKRFLELQLENVSLAQNVFETVTARVEAGKVPPTEQSKAMAFLSSSKIKERKAGNELLAAKENLVALWGGNDSGVSLPGDLENLRPLPEESTPQDLCDKNLELARWEVETEKARQRVILEKAQRIPDVRISAGYRRYSETGDSAWTLSASIPLKIFNRNAGKIRASHDRLLAVESKKSDEKNRLIIHYRNTRRELISARESVLRMQKEILPSVQWVFEATREGYREGKFTYLQVLDAQRTFFQMKQEYIASLLRDHLQSIELERISGWPAESFPATNTTSGRGEMK